MIISQRKDQIGGLIYVEILNGQNGTVWLYRIPVFQAINIAESFLLKQKQFVQEVPRSTIPNWVQVAQM